MITPNGFLMPDWNAPAGVRAFVSTRRAPGISQAPWDACNLGDHVDDHPDAVIRNRALLRSALSLPAEPSWLRQVHGIEVWRGGNEALRQPAIADAAVTRMPGQVLAVLTADCLPVLLCADDGSEVAAVHAGWRGLVAGVIEATVQAMQTPPSRLHAWMGPAIGPMAFEVGSDVRDAVLSSGGDVDNAFVAVVGKPEKWWCDLYQLARMRMQAIGLERVSGGGYCTASDPDRFFSHRRDRLTGRMASLIWIDPQEADVASRNIQGAQQS